MLAETGARCLMMARFLQIELGGDEEVQQMSYEVVKERFRLGGCEGLELRS